MNFDLGTGTRNRSTNITFDRGANICTTKAFTRHRLVNRFMREYRLYGLTDDATTSSCYYIFMDTQVTKSFTTFSTFNTMMIQGSLGGLPQDETLVC